uniref:Uncharacterized protein n=1 Tax=Arundo donax TaxID=35708 RepID=A0A0A8YU05_ARUDO
MPMPRSERCTRRGLDSGKWKTRFRPSLQWRSSTWRSSTRTRRRTRGSA